MSGYVSGDGHWKVSVIRRDGIQYMRAEHDAPRVAGRAVLHWGPDRLGPVATSRGWWLVKDCRTTEELAALVSLASLEEA